MTNDPRPEPLVGADIDVRDLDGFMLNVERLLASELWALSTGEEFKAAVALWCRAWKQIPAGSLPNDQRVLASFAGVTTARWAKIRTQAMRGFVECSDGRLYHRTLCEDALRGHACKVERRIERDGDADRKRREREDRAQMFTILRAAGHVPAWNASTNELRDLVKRVTGNGPPVTVPVRVTGGGPVTAPVTVPVTRTVTVSQGQDRTGQDEENPTPSPSSDSPRVRATPAAAGGARSRVSGFDPGMVRDAVERGDALAVIRAFGAASDPERDVEWLRDAAWLQVGELAAILWWEADERAPVRHPSGLRAARKRWDAQDIEDRRDNVRHVSRRLGIHVPPSSVVETEAAHGAT